MEVNFIHILFILIGSILAVDVENNNRQCMKSIESNRRLWSKSLNTCNDLKAYGITESGKYFLSSPEDEDKKEPFEVECQFSTDGSVETIVKNTNNATNAQLTYLKKISKSCHQNATNLKCSGVQPIDCIWGSFQPTSECSKTCGEGVQSFTRVRIQDSKYGGLDCEGYPTELRSCVGKPCPVDCKWGPFKPSSECSKICGGRLKNFTRNIIQEANHGGTECIGDATKQESCNEGTCTPPTDCYEAKEGGLNRLPGTFTLQIDSENTIKAFCDADGYTYLMSRGQFQNPKDYFNKNWNGYKTAFGETNKEYWIGLDMMNKLTNRGDRPMQLRVKIEKFSGEKAINYYDTFKIGNEASNYTLTVGGFHGDGDALEYHNGMAFSTIDRDNDPWYYNCASKSEPGAGAGWWYKGCIFSNLNGLNHGYAKPAQESMSWSVWSSGNKYESLKSASMAIRPLNV